MYLLRRKFKQAKRIQLTNPAKERIRENLVHLIRTSQAPRSVKISSFSFSYSFTKYKHLPALVVLLIALSFTTAFAAEKALPGDALYGVKTGVNEKIKEVLSFSKEAKYRFQVKIIEERLWEYEQLATTGQLNKESQVSLETLINLSFARMDNYFYQLASSSAYSTQAQLYNKLSAHKSVIQGLIENFENMENLSSAISQIQLIETKLKPAIKLLGEVKSSEDLSEVEKRIQDKTSKIRENVSGKNTQLYTKVIEQINGQLEESQKALREGSILNQKGNTDNARELLESSERAAERAEKILEIQEGLDIKMHIEKGQITEKKQKNEVENPDIQEEIIEKVDEVVEEVQEVLNPLGI
ncbi:MAG: DUF5667 domain-containing protein [bacterium]|nr:DUF5667 domain-containing protein [bacterium]